jgi:hypothetical protein
LKVTTLRKRGLSGAAHGAARQTDADQEDVGRDEHRCRQSKPPVSRRRGENQQENCAKGRERQAVIEKIERRPPAREQAEHRETGAQCQACDDRSFQPRLHLQRSDFGRGGGRKAGQAPI